MRVFPMAAARTSAPSTAKSSLKSPRSGTMTVAETPARAAPSEALGGPLAFWTVVPGDEEAGAGGRHPKEPRLPAESAAGAPKRTARPWMRPSAFLGVGASVLAGRRGSTAQFSRRDSASGTRGGSPYCLQAWRQVRRSTMRIVLAVVWLLVLYLPASVAETVQRFDTSASSATHQGELYGADGALQHVTSHEGDGIFVRQSSSLPVWLAQADQNSFWPNKSRRPFSLTSASCFGSWNGTSVIRESPGAAAWMAGSCCVLPCAGTARCSTPKSSQPRGMTLFARRRCRPWRAWANCRNFLTRFGVVNSGWKSPLPTGVAAGKEINHGCRAGGRLAAGAVSACERDGNGGAGVGHAVCSTSTATTPVAASTPMIVTALLPTALESLLEETLFSYGPLTCVSSGGVPRYVPWKVHQQKGNTLPTSVAR